MINRGAEEALFSLSNERKWPAIAFWARVNRVKAITHVQDRLVTRLPISSPRVNRGFFSLNRSLLWFHLRVLRHSFFLSFFLLPSIKGFSRVVGFHPVRPWTWASKPSTETWKHLVELFMKRAWHGERSVRGKSREAKRFRFVVVAYITFLLFENVVHGTVVDRRIGLNIENKRCSRFQPIYNRLFVR